jgi:predicted regulator of Ras-like GTPase activity (Roadblock/LC7/MglB family)
MNQRVDRALERLTHAPGVRGAMVVDAEAGIAVASDLNDDVEERALAALAGSLFARTSGATRSAAFGDVRLLQLNGSDGHMVVAGAPPLLVVAVTGHNAQLGLVRVEVERAAKELS